MNVDFLDVWLKERQTFQVYKVNDFLFFSLCLPISSNVIAPLIVSIFVCTLISHVYTWMNGITISAACIFLYYIFLIPDLFDQFDELTCTYYIPDDLYAGRSICFMVTHVVFIFILNTIFKQIAYFYLILFRD